MGLRWRFRVEGPLSLSLKTHPLMLMLVMPQADLDGKGSISESEYGKQMTCERSQY